MALSNPPAAIGLALGLFLLSTPPFLPCIAATSDSEVSVTVYEGPTSCTNTNADDAGDPNQSLLTQVVNETVVGLHFTVTIDENSKTGERGAKVESSLERGVAPSFPVGRGKVIPGLDQGLLGLCKGSKAHIVIPPHLAYGDSGVPNSNVPGGATLRYDVEILDIRRPAANDFSLIDTNNDGKLSKTEAKEYFDGKGQMIDIDALFEAEDTNSDGYVDWNEFTGPKGDGPPDIVVQQQRQKIQEEQVARAQALQQQQAQAQAQAQAAQRQEAEIFQQMDADGDSQISKVELAAAFAAMGSEMTEEFWKESDVDGSGFVDFREFVGDIVINSAAGEKQDEL
jgi:FKBP-type peptidyl-prolyl cis-trans isomerase